jgi:hypothetical protein
MGLRRLLVLGHNVECPVAALKARQFHALWGHDVGAEPVADRPSLRARVDEAVGHHHEHRIGE